MKKNIYDNTLVYSTTYDSFNHMIDTVISDVTLGEVTTATVTTRVRKNRYEYSDPNKQTFTSQIRYNLEWEAVETDTSSVLLADINVEVTNNNHDFVMTHMTPYHEEAVKKASKELIKFRNEQLKLINSNKRPANGFRAKYIDKLIAEEFGEIELTQLVGNERPDVIKFIRTLPGDHSDNSSDLGCYFITYFKGFIEHVERIAVAGNNVHVGEGSIVYFCHGNYPNGSDKFSKGVVEEVLKNGHLTIVDDNERTHVVNCMSVIAE